jgi:caa(3)-type oxidase subunit IV
MSNHPQEKHYDSHQGPESGHQEHHVLDVGVMVKIGVTLLILTAITVATSRIDLGVLNFPLAMLIATAKALLVCMFFMGLKYDHKENSVIFATAFLFLLIFVGFTASDIFFRGDVYVKKGAASATAPGEAKFKKPWNAGPELVAHGKELFGQQCASCHGAAGLGDGVAAGGMPVKPRNFSVDAGWKNGRKASEVYGTLSKGLAPYMPSFATLKGEDRWALAHYLRTLGSNQPQDSEADLVKAGVDLSKDTMPGEGLKAVTLPVETVMDIMVKEKGTSSSQ